MRVYLALPSYNQQYWGGTMMSVLHCGLPPSTPLLIRPGVSDQPHIEAVPLSGSILPRVFNEAVARAVTGKCDVLVMLHADLGAEPGWLTKLTTILERSGADVVSVVAPLKDERELSSTAIHTHDARFRKLSLAECRQCEIVFTVQDVVLQQMGATELLVNTGMFAMRLDRPWLRKWQGFQIRSRIVWNEREVVVDTCSEDWDMSEQLNALGCKVAATTAIKLHHYGGKVYDSGHRQE